jgi:dolichol-phosphate mannosyltransferase
MILGLTGTVLLPSLGGGLLIIVAAILGIGGINLVALGVIGEYVWRALEDARRRPPYLIEAVAGEFAGAPRVPEESFR